MTQSYTPVQTSVEWFDDFYNGFCQRHGIAKIPFANSTPQFTPEEAQKHCADWLDKYYVRRANEALGELFD